MRVPLSWLQEFISLTIPPVEIAKILTMAGLEVDEYETLGDNLKDVVVGQVLETKKHPNADRLTIATVTDGRKNYQVVCAASNCRTGLKTAFARSGTTLKHADYSFSIQETEIRGVKSEGMLCAEDEIGLAETSEGILELAEDAVVGTSLYDMFADTYFDISLTPNLSHCTSIFGIARELSALTGVPLHYPSIKVKEGQESIDHFLSVQVDDKENCPRYACRVVRNVKVGPSPNWLRNRLEKCGVRSVNNLVDVTNYVLLEFGHPLHAFDYDKLEDQEIVVRKAKEGEMIHTLDNKERPLKETMLMICDHTKPVAIAGVMGGANSEIQNQTCNIVIESAYFNPMSIRRTSKQLGLQTDASKRFERGTDPNQIHVVLDHAASLIQQVAGGEIASGILDVKSKEFPVKLISCRLNRINQIIGRPFSHGEVEDVFKRLGFPFQWEGLDKLLVNVPTYRVDISSEIDLVEEVARLYGYDNIPRRKGRYVSSSLPSVPIYLFEKEVRSRLIGEGLQEFLTCDLIGPSLIQIVQDTSPSTDSMIKVLNPTSIEQSILRTSLLPGLLQVAKYNFDHQNRNIAGFEVGRIHFKEGESYKESSVAGILLMGQAFPSHWGHKESNFDFFDLKGIVENLLKAFGISDHHYQNLNLKTFHSGRQASIFVGSLELGSIGEIHPAIQRRLDVPERILFGEFNLHDLMKIVKPVEQIEPLPIYPSSERDWTFTVKDSVPFAKIFKIIDTYGSEILEKVSLKDIYRSDKLTAGYQNMTLHFVYRNPLKTIEQEAVELEHHRLTHRVLEELRA